MRLLPLLCLLAAGCVGAHDDADLGDFAAGDAAGGGKADGAGDVTLLRDLEHAAFPGTGRVDALVYTPPGLDLAAPIDVVVFLHGHYNCVENVVRKRNGACTRGGPARQAYDLAAQLDASGKQAVLLVPELAFDRASSSAGALVEPGRFASLLDEVASHVGAAWDDVVVIAHSGGYRTAARIAEQFPVRELYLLDALYGETDAFRAWIEEDLASFAPDAAWRRRFGTFYTGGTPQTLSRGLAGAIAPQLDEADVLIDDHTTRTWGDEDHARGLQFKRSGLGHDSIVRWYFGRILAASEP